MAGSSNGSSSSSSSSSSSAADNICRLPEDQLLSILLHLPVDSILCFGITCKKLRSLITQSDALWESICRRDWGASFVDVLINTTNTNIQWKKLYQQVYRLDSVYCHGSLLDKDVPSPRASHSLNFVSGFLVLFGGGCEGGRHLDDTWVAYMGDDFKKILKWQKVGSGIPTGRFGHSCVVVGDALVLFGGISDLGIRKNDTWIGKLMLQADTFAVTLSWRLLDVENSVVPPPRGAHAACSIDKKKMLIFGGIGPSGTRLGDTWMLELSENLSCGTWLQIMACPSPPSRSGHTLTHIGGENSILFGGRGSRYDVLEDVWLFEGGYPGQWRWRHIVFDLQSIPQGLSLPRVGHSATLILGGRLLIYGGEDSYRHRKDDFWVLDIKMHPTISLKMWKRWKATGNKPMCRSFHRACADDSGRYLYVLGGMVDGLLHPGEAVGLRFDSGLFLVELLL
ncbi:OLC1v1015318C1 [Oldenlandia corymbosa var. corymbosa]|uniref:OLC1v1015318C1 n=1 Tax=Oldenlandia corymbosa var. corymbosa TaxID=529605 RepID=A0AAV1E6E5_OLDCO|nr:OLC1v1015318C1 [Oldenlandia corymbosa var. corymbosa]